MADNNNDNHRSRVAGEQNYHPVLRRGDRISAEQAREALKKHGNDRETLKPEATN